MAHDKCAPLAGTIVALTDDRGPLRGCPKCGCRAGRIVCPPNKHPGAVRCDRCDTHIGWLSAKHLEGIAATRRAS